MCLGWTRHHRVRWVTGGLTEAGAREHAKELNAKHYPEFLYWAEPECRDL